MYRGSQDFLAWAESYESAELTQRSLVRHEAWLAALPCAVLRLDGTADAATLPGLVVAALR